MGGVDWGDVVVADVGFFVVGGVRNFDRECFLSGVYVIDEWLFGVIFIV